MGENGVRNKGSHKARKGGRGTMNGILCPAGHGSALWGFAPSGSWRKWRWLLGWLYMWLRCYEAVARMATSYRDHRMTLKPPWVGLRRSSGGTGPHAQGRDSLTTSDRSSLSLPGSFNLTMKLAFLSWFCWWGNWGSERFCSLLKAYVPELYFFPPKPNF